MYRIYASLISTVYVLCRAVHKYAYYMLILHIYAYTYTGLLSFLLCGMTSSAIAMSATYPIGTGQKGLICVYILYVYYCVYNSTYVWAMYTDVKYDECSVWHWCV